MNPMVKKYNKNKLVFILHFSFSFKFDFGGEAEVCDFDFHVFVEQHVSEFEVAVDDFLTVNILASFY